MQVRQGLAKGLGHAVLCAHPVVGDEPVAVILPDVILDEYESDLSQDNLAEMIRRFDETGHSQIMVEPVADDCGNKLGYMQAFVEYGIRHNTLGTEFKAWLEEEMGIKK